MGDIHLCPLLVGIKRRLHDVIPAATCATHAPTQVGERVSGGDTPVATVAIPCRRAAWKQVSKCTEARRSQAPDSLITLFHALRQRNKRHDSSEGFSRLDDDVNGRESCFFVKRPVTLVVKGTVSLLCSYQGKKHRQSWQDPMDVRSSSQKRASQRQGRPAKRAALDLLVPWQTVARGIVGKLAPLFRFKLLTRSAWKLMDLTQKSKHDMPL